MTSLVAVVCALGAALLYGLASVLQQRTASTVDADQSLRIGLLGRLLRNPVWVIGVGCDAAGFVLQFVALDVGSLVLVQPLLVCGLLFALPIGAKLNGARLARSDWVSALAVCVGLGVFLVVASPEPGHDFISPATWLLLLTAGGGLSVLLAAIGQQASGRAKALFLSAGAGTIYGVAAALTKTTGALFSNGILAAFGHWEPYALAVIGVGGMLIAQSAFQAGAIDVSLPTMSAVDPVVSICIGALAFGESIAGGVGPVIVQVVSLMVMVLGIYGLARRPAPAATSAASASASASPSAPAPAPASTSASASASASADRVERSALAAGGSPPGLAPAAGRSAASPVGWKHRRVHSVRPASEVDVPVLSDLLARAWRATYRDLMPAATIDTAIDEYYSDARIRSDVPASEDGRTWSGYLVATDPDGQVVGATAGGLTGPEVGEVFVLYADPDQLGRGIGTILLRTLSQAQIDLGATEQWLSVTEGNQLALPFYLARGFAVDSESLPWDEIGDVRCLRMRRPLI